MATVIENINRATDALLSVKKAIMDKGVNVPSGTKAEEYAGLIGSIEGGGGDTAAAYNEGYEQGKVDEKNAFENMFTYNWRRNSYRYAFSGQDWSGYVFSQTLRPTNVTAMFSGYNGVTLPEPLDLSGVTTHPAQMFDGADLIESLKDYGLPAPAQYNRTFAGMSLCKKIAIVRVNEATTFNTPFQNCGALEDITFEGTIGQNGLSFQGSPKLNKASIISIINCLSTTTTGLTVTFSLTAVNNAFETSEGAADGSTSEEWLNLVATKPNVEVILV